MKAMEIKPSIYKIGAVDWDRRLFDSLVPLPDGTSYNAYLIYGSEKTVLIDSVDPDKSDILINQLKDTAKIDYIISHHTEQDHSGSIPLVMQKYPDAKVIASDKGKGMLADHLLIPEDKIIVVKDGETINLGNKTLEFVYTPWVHWPETMSTYLREDNILFTCDFFGSHLATSDLFVTDEGRVYEAAKRYFAEIMMPFRSVIQKNMEKLRGYKIDIIAPSHGPLYDKPAFIIDAYTDWVFGPPKNVAVIPYVSMHGSTKVMVEYLVSVLAEKGVKVEQYDITATDIGKLAISLVDAATVVIGTPTFQVGPHPAAVYVAHLANLLRPKVKFVSVVGSFGWSSSVVEKISGLIPNLKAELIDPVICKGYPKSDTYQALDIMAQTISNKHREMNLTN